MSNEDEARSLEAARRAAEASGVPIGDDRLQAFASSLARNVEMMRKLLAADLGETEPASRFRAPPR
jgi:hypothetical protein